MSGFDTVLAATEASIKAAKHLGLLDAGAVEVLRHLARTIDAISDGQDADADADVDTDPRKPRSLDNVTIPTYLKACDALGLTPAGRVRLDEKKEAPGGKLAHLRKINGGKSA
jgi:hypothetical protein